MGDNTRSDTISSVPYPRQRPQQQERVVEVPQPRQEQVHHHVPEASKVSENGTVSWGGGIANSDDRRPSSAKTNNDTSTFGNWSPPVKKESSSTQGWTDEEERANGDKRGMFDDGTAVWGNPVRTQKPVSRWKEEQAEAAAAAAALAAALANGKSPNCANGNNAPSQSGANSSSSNLPPASPGMIRLPPGAPQLSKSNEVWNKSQQTPQQMNRLNPWADGVQPQTNREMPIMNTSGWGQGQEAVVEAALVKSVPGTPGTPNSGWGDPASSPQAYWGNKPRNSSSWSDGQIVDTTSWGGAKQKPLSKDMIWASKQFRMLVENGFKVRIIFYLCLRRIILMPFLYCFFSLIAR